MGNKAYRQTDKESIYKYIGLDLAYNILENWKSSQRFKDAEGYSR